MAVNNVDQLLAQMRVMTAQARQEVPVATEQTNGFAHLLSESLDKVNQLQLSSAAMGEDFELGRGNYSLAEVMIAKQKASLAFQASVQVRNKLVETYKTIMNMPI